MNLVRRIFPCLLLTAMLVMPGNAFADWGIVDQLNLAPFVPYVLDAMMSIATSGYDFFVGNGNGIIYILALGFVAITITLYLVKLYIPGNWSGLFGFSGGGEMLSGKATSETIIYNVLKPCLRCVIATALLLQIRPAVLTTVLVNPFLQFGAIYTNAITQTIHVDGVAVPQIDCPESIIQQGWITESSCKFLVQPVADLSAANNTVIKRGFQFITNGLRGLFGVIPHGSNGFLNLITGIILVSTFFSSNLFMALLIIEGIFKFGMALILYPFHVLSYVAKPSDKWLDIWPAFAGITKELQNLVITMIMCSFMLCINIAIIKSLFTWNGSVFVVGAGGAATSNVPSVAQSVGGFGEHSILWLSSILTFYLMFQLFDRTQKQLKKYVDGNGELYDQVMNDSRTLWNGVKKLKDAGGKALGWIKGE